MKKEGAYNIPKGNMEERNQGKIVKRVDWGKGLAGDGGVRLHEGIC